MQVDYSRSSALNSARRKSEWHSVNVIERICGLALL